LLDRSHWSIAGNTASLTPMLSILQLDEQGVTPLSLQSWLVTLLPAVRQYFKNFHFFKFSQILVIVKTHLHCARQKSGSHILSEKIWCSEVQRSYVSCHSYGMTIWSTLKMLRVKCTLRSMRWRWARREPTRNLPSVNQHHPRFCSLLASAPSSRSNFWLLPRINPLCPPEQPGVAQPGTALPLLVVTHFFWEEISVDFVT
jgi:hypothetical protein